MSGVNKVIIIGNLGKDPEVKAVGSTTVANFSLATSENYTDKSGTKRQVYVEGKLQTREYEKDGQKRYSTEIVANNITFLGGGAGGKDAAKDDELF